MDALVFRLQSYTDGLDAPSILEKIEHPEGFSLKYEFRVSASGSMSLPVFPQSLGLYTSKHLCLELLDFSVAVTTLWMRINEVTLLCSGF